MEQVLGQRLVRSLRRLTSVLLRILVISFVRVRLILRVLLNMVVCLRTVGLWNGLRACVFLFRRQVMVVDRLVVGMWAMVGLLLFLRWGTALVTLPVIDTSRALRTVRAILQVVCSTVVLRAVLGRRVSECRAPVALRCAVLTCLVLAPLTRMWGLKNLLVILLSRLFVFYRAVWVVVTLFVKVLSVVRLGKSLQF